MLPHWLSGLVGHFWDDGRTWSRCKTSVSREVRYMKAQFQTDEPEGYNCNLLSVDKRCACPLVGDAPRNYDLPGDSGESRIHGSFLHRPKSLVTNVRAELRLCDKNIFLPRKSNAADPNRLARAERCWFVLLLKSNSVCYAPNTIDFHAHDIRILEEFIAEKAHARRCPSHDDRALPQRSTSGKVSNYLSD